MNSFTDELVDREVGTRMMGFGECQPPVGGVTVKADGHEVQRARSQSPRWVFYLRIICGLGHQ